MMLKKWSQSTSSSDGAGTRSSESGTETVHESRKSKIRNIKELKDEQDGKISSRLLAKKGDQTDQVIQIQAVVMEEMNSTGREKPLEKDTSMPLSTHKKKRKTKNLSEIVPGDDKVTNNPEKERMEVATGVISSPAKIEEISEKEQKHLQKQKHQQKQKQQQKKEKLKALLTKEDIRARDRERMREQHERRMERQRAAEELAHQQALLRNQTALWQKRQAQMQESMLLKYEIDNVDVRKEHPTTAGYNVWKANYDPRVTSPIFYKFKYFPSTSESSMKHFSSERLHPVTMGYDMFAQSVATVSPIFWDLMYKKRVVGGSEDDVDDLGNDHRRSKSEGGTGLEIPNQTSPATLTQLMASRFKLYCTICVDGKIPGCPGCWEVPAYIQDLRNKKNVKIPSKEAPSRQRTPRTTEPCNEDFVDAVPFLVSQTVHEEEDFESEEEQNFYDNLLIDELAIEKYRFKFQYYLHFVVKRIPGGNVIHLSVDSNDIIKYLYDLYRANFGKSDEKIYLILPTSVGLFVLDETLRAETDLDAGVNHGNLFLKDYNLKPPIKNPIILLSVASIHPTHTPHLINYYVQNNFVVEVDVNIRLRHVASDVPEDLESDETQGQMILQTANITQAAEENRQLAEDYTRLQKEKIIKKAFEERMREAFDRKKTSKEKDKARPRTKKEMRAWMYYKYAMDERNPFERLSKLWECFQKFEELGICKNGQLQQYFNCPDTRDLLAQHLRSAMEVFGSVTNTTDRRLTKPLQYLTNGKLVIYVGERLGITTKEDRIYGIQLVLQGDLSPTKDSRSDSTSGVSPRGVILTKGLPYTDCEWMEKSVNEILYVTNDLTMHPFYNVRWDYLAQAYTHNLRYVEQATALLNQFNALAIFVAQHHVFNPTELKNWRLQVAELRNDIGPTGCLCQASRRLEIKVKILKNAIAQHKRELQEAADAAKKRAKALENPHEQTELAPTAESTTTKRIRVKSEELKIDFMRSQGTLSLRELSLEQRYENPKKLISEGRRGAIINPRLINPAFFFKKTST